MHEVKEFNDLADAEELRSDWQAMLPQTPGASFFYSLDWLRIYWRHFGGEQKLRLLSVCRSGRPAGILPLVVRSEPTRAGRVKVLTFPLHDWGSFYGPISADPAQTLRHGLAHVARTRRDWHMIDLRWISAEDWERQGVESAMRRAGFSALRRVWCSTALVELAGGWDAYWKSRTSHWRNNVRRHEKKLSARGNVEYVRYRPAGGGESDPRWDLYDACEWLARRSWQGSSRTGTTLSHESIRGYLRDAHAAAAHAGALDVNLLRVDGTPVAFAYNYVYRGYVFGLRVGFDPDYREGAGNVLYHRTFQDSAARGDHTYDLGPGSLSIKECWMTRTADVLRCTHFHPLAWRAQVLRLKARWQARSEVGGQWPGGVRVGG
jgi:CelD/BcsL family acetyltransferase involved in cellulose biosynthesis